MIAKTLTEDQISLKALAISTKIANHEIGLERGAEEIISLIFRVKESTVPEWEE